MQNANDLNRVSVQAIEEDIGMHEDCPQSGPEIVSGSPEPGTMGGFRGRR